MLYKFWLIASFLALQSQATFVANEGKVNFISNAPLEVIKASSEKLQGAIDAEKRTFLFKIPIKSFKGFNSALQRTHFNENYMESDKYPEATFKGKIIENIDLQEAGTHEVRAKGKLFIHGVEQDRIIKATLVSEKNKVKVISEFNVPLSDHNITIPKLVYQKIATEIEVRMEAEFELVNN
jgi:polyisoprenoid-binding protein YceI